MYEGAIDAEGAANLAVLQDLVILWPWNQSRHVGGVPGNSEPYGRHQSAFVDAPLRGATIRVGNQ